MPLTSGIRVYPSLRHPLPLKDLGTRLPCLVCVAIERSIVDQSAKRQEYRVLLYLRLVILDACLPLLLLSTWHISVKSHNIPALPTPFKLTWSWRFAHGTSHSIRFALFNFYIDSRRRGTSSIFHNSIEHNLTRAATAASTTSSRWATLSVGSTRTWLPTPTRDQRGNPSQSQHGACLILSFLYW